VVPTLYLGLHPSAEDVELTLPGERAVRVCAKTSTTGPGYHAYLCELLDAFGHAMGISWQAPTEEDLDETGYFHARDIAALDAEFLAWLKGLAGALLEREKEGGSGFAISMATDVRFDDDAFMTTPVGPRSVDWAESRSPPRGRSGY
jgi:hypothetical protein